MTTGDEAPSSSAGTINDSTAAPTSPTGLSSVNVLTSILTGGSDNEESAAWLNILIQELWPYAANISQFVLLEYVQPALNAAMPIGLPAPKFSKIDIGTKAVEIEKICVQQRKFGKNDTAAVIEADIHFDSQNMDVKMTYSDFTFGVDHVKLTGRIEVVLRPLVDYIPLLGAGQIAFINTPKLEYNLTGLAALGNKSMIRGILSKVVESVMGSVVVLPNRVAYKSSPDVDYFNLSTQPVGILRVAALNGKGFPSTDRDIFKQTVGLSELPDVYLVLKHGNITFQTKRVDNSANPEYTNQIFDFVLTSESMSQELSIEAYDFDLGINNDDFLGRATVRVSDVVKGISTIRLQDSPEDATPTVQLATKWLDISSDLRHIQYAIMSQRSDTLRPKDCSALLLTVEVDEAHHLPPGKRPYVKLRIGKQHTFQTSAAYDLPGMFSVEHPEFEQSFHIPLQGDTDASVRVEFSIIDQMSSDVLGWAYCSLSEAVEAGPDGKQYDFALMGAHKPNASLRARTKLSAVLDQPTPLWKVLADGEETS